jgi:O-antigen ligase
VRRFGLADGVGIVGALVALSWLPGAADPLTYIKLLVLIGGGLALAPAVVMRWKRLGRPSWATLLPSAAATLLVLWGVISIIGASAPLWNSLMGWWGRGDGLLAWVGALFVLLGAATLSAREVGRTITWLMGGASLVALIGLLQVAGVNIPEGAAGQVSGTMGNTNFAAGYFAILGVLALGRALTEAVLWHRIWGGVLFVLLGFLALRTDSVQGPVALTAAVAALAVAYGLLYRGTFRKWFLAGSASVVALGLLAVVGSITKVGPLGSIWQQQTFQIRQQYWQSAINIMNGLPIFGTGPDGFSRYVAEFRPESYVELLGPTLRVSAAHNIALQFGASLGYIGLILWITLFVGTGLVLLARMVRAPVGSIGLTASVAGAFTAYFIQGMVSIDMLPLLATGWLVAGLALAMAREPIAAAEPDPVLDASKSRKAKAASVSRTPRSFDGPSTPVWVPVTGGVLGLLAAILVGIQIGVVNGVQSIDSQEKALAFIANPMTPCPLRVQVTQQVIQQLPAEVSVPATLDATDLDRRCPPMINFASDVLVQQQRFDEASPYTAEGVEFDPLLDLAWVLRARYYLGVGDVPAAEAAAEEARRVQALYPDGASDPALVETLFNDLALAKEQA